MKHYIEIAYRKWESFHARLSWICAAAAITLMMITVIDVTGRFFLKPFDGAQPISAAILIVITYLNLSFSDQKEGHIRVDLLKSRLSPRGVDITDIFSYGLGVMLLALISWGSTGIALFSFETREAVSGSFHLPIYPFKFLVAVGLWVFTVQFLFRMVTAGMHVFTSRRVK